MNKFAFAFLLLASTSCFGQTCDPMATAQEAKIKTDKIDADYGKQFDALALELQKSQACQTNKFLKSNLKQCLIKTS
jgi:hypothetical protein